MPPLWRGWAKTMTATFSSAASPPVPVSLLAAPRSANAVQQLLRQGGVGIRLQHLLELPFGLVQQACLGIENAQCQGGARVGHSGALQPVHLRPRQHLELRGTPELLAS